MVVRSITSDAECVVACEVASLVLPSKVAGAGLNPGSWARLEAQKLIRSKTLWDHYGEQHGLLWISREPQRHLKGHL